MQLRFFLLLVGMVMAAGPLRSEGSPVAVSPGSTSKLAPIESRCPTFSWGAVAGARGYELVVYALGWDGKEADPVLQQSFAGSVSGWTPSLDHCLEHGRRYAWSIRALVGAKKSEWSTPSLFQVMSAPTEAEFESALEVVRQYLAENTGTEKGAHGSAESSAAQRLTGPSSPAAMAGDAALQVNGSAVVTVATLSAALETTCVGRRWLDQGDGTVMDCNTRLIWLKDASCFDLEGTTGGAGDWATAQSAATALHSGSCGLTDFSQPGDWRVPAISELCSAAPLSNQICPAANGTTSLVDTRFPGSPKVSNGIGTGTWTEGNPFVGVAYSVYWSATEVVPGEVAYTADLGTGLVGAEANNEVESYFVWPVRSAP